MLSFLFRQKKFYFFIFLMSLFLSGQTYAAGVITGTIWNDIDADQINEVGSNVALPFGDPNLPDSGIEAGFKNVVVKLLDNTGAEIATSNSIADGSYTFLSQADGTYTLLFEAPDRFDFSAVAPANDHFSNSDPAPAPGNPQTARIAINIAGSDVTAGTGVGLRPLTEFTIDTADLNPDPNLSQAAIESGKPTFDPFGDCAYDGTNSEETADFKATLRVRVVIVTILMIGFVLMI